MAVLTGNEIGYNANFGLQILSSSGSGANMDGSSRTNSVIGNALHDNSLSTLRINSANGNFFLNNIIAGTSSQFVDIQNSTGNVFTTNDLSANTTVRSTGTATFLSQTLFVDQPSVLVKLDTHSKLTLRNSAGTIYKVGSAAVATTVSSFASTLVLTSGNIGTKEVNLTVRHLSMNLDAGIAALNASGWNEAPAALKSWIWSAGQADQTAAFVVGDLTPGAAYTIKKNGIVIKTAIADQSGMKAFLPMSPTRWPPSLIRLHSPRNRLVGELFHPASGKFVG